MSYKKFLKNVNLPKARMGSVKSSDSANAMYNKWKNYLPEIYQGPNNRMERYSIYDGMEQDPVVAWSMDIISDFVTQTDSENPFRIKYTNEKELPETQTLSLEIALKDWVKLNDWKKRLFQTIRDSLKYGDVFFIRDPETNVLNKVNIYDVLGVVVDELKNPTHYVIKNVNLNVPLKIATDSSENIQSQSYLNAITTNFPAITSNANPNVMTPTNPTDDQATLAVEAKHVVHVTTNVDNNVVYPFGISTLENIYKAYIQKMLLQDCILLYRIKNATEKLVFSIPVGSIPRYKRKQFLEKCKNELSQRRMPSKDSDGVFNTIDVAYNSIPMNEDYWLPVDSDGVQPKIEKLAGGQNLGEINDMVYWENLIIRGLKVPQSWVPYGPTDGERTVPNTSNVFVQEQRFLKYCERIQDILITEFDTEFKKYLKYRAIEINETSFELAFFEPSNITELTEEEINKTRLDAFNTAISNPYLSKRFAMKYYLKLTDDEFNENQRLLMEENQEKFKDKDVPLPTEDKDQVPGLRTIGIEDIPQDYVDEMTQDMSNPMGGADLGGMGGADLGGMGGADLGGAPMGGADLGGAPMGGDMSAGGM